ncbi:antitoxin [Chromatiales bacterium (ex Bugula neritina AB1)]|nr:antitoxin [Chromatiales bacterium (ex Bugula neritina AB1)]
MKDQYDFSKMKGKKNPYTKQLKQPVTMRLDKDTVAYFKSLSEQMDIPYQSLINLYLRDCAMNERKLEMKWVVDDEK